MESELPFGTLIELFNKSLARAQLGPKAYLEIVRPERQEMLTFEQLRAEARNFASWLIQVKALRARDKIAILGKNRIDWDLALWGVILAGGVPVLIDAERPPEGVMCHLTTTDTRLIVAADDYQDADSRRRLKDLAAALGLDLVEMTGTPFCGLPKAEKCTAPDLLKKEKKHRLWGPCTICLESKNTRQGTGSESTDPDQLLNDAGANIKPDDTAVILCTSGTTADPREVELSHHNIIANIQGALETVKITSTDKLAHIIPPHHSFGFTVTKLLPLWVGATNVYTNKYRKISQLIRDKDITVFIGIPALFTLLAKRIEQNLAQRKEKSLLLGLADRCFPKSIGKKIIQKQGWKSLRFFISGAAPMPRWVLQAFWKRGIELREGYGTTENSPVYGFNADARTLGSVGRPIPTLMVRIVDEKDQTLRPGQKGQILLGGPCIMKGYYKNPKATEAMVRTDDKGVRWLYTGDLGYLDGEGHLFITGRKKYVIVLPGGKNVNPEHVESVLSQADYVQEILIVPDFAISAGNQGRNARQDDAHSRQEAVRAIVRPEWELIESNTSLDRVALIEQPKVLKNLIWQSIDDCQRNSRQLSGFEKVSPHRLEIKIDEFIKTSTGKIKRDLYIKSLSE